MRVGKFAIALCNFIHRNRRFPRKQKMIKPMFGYSWHRCQYVCKQLLTKLITQRPICGCWSCNYTPKVAIQILFGAFGQTQASCLLLSRGWVDQRDVKIITRNIECGTFKGLDTKKMTTFETSCILQKQNLSSVAWACWDSDPRPVWSQQTKLY